MVNLSEAAYLYALLHQHICVSMHNEAPYDERTVFSYQDESNKIELNTRVRSDNRKK